MPLISAKIKEKLVRLFFDDNYRAKSFGDRQFTDGVLVDSSTGFTYADQGAASIIGAFTDTSGACISLRANALASAEWNIIQTSRNGETKPVSNDNPFVKLFMNPTLAYLRYEFYKLGAEWFDYKGDVFIRYYNPGFPNREPNTFDLLESDNVEIVTTTSGIVTSYNYTDQYGNYYKYSPDEILHIRNIYPKSIDNRGVGLSEIAWAAIMQNRDINAYITKFVNNTNMPAVYIKQNMGKEGGYVSGLLEQALSFAESMNTNPRLPFAAGVVPGGYELKDVSVDNINKTTISIPELIEIADQTISQTYAVPLSLLTGNSANYATLKISQQKFFKDSIDPLLTIFEQSFTQMIQKFDPSLSFVYVRPTTTLTPDEQDSRYNTLLGNGIVTINETRADLGKDPVQGGDVPRIAGFAIDGSDKTIETEQKALKKKV